MLAQNVRGPLFLLILVPAILCTAFKKNNVRRKRGLEARVTAPPAAKRTYNQEDDDDEAMLDLWDSFRIDQGASASLKEQSSESLPKVDSLTKFSGLFNEDLNLASRAEAMVDYFRLVFNREIRNMLRVQLKIDGVPPSPNPGSSADEFLGILGSLELSPLDEQLRLVLYRLCAVLGRMARGDVASAAWVVADTLTSELDESRRERLYELASELLLSYVDYFWLPDQSEAAKSFPVHRARFESFLERLRKMDDFEPCEAASPVGLALVVNIWIVPMCKAFGPPTSSIDRLHELKGGLWYVDHSLSILSTEFIPEALDADSFQRLQSSMLRFVSPRDSPNAPSIPSLLRPLQLLRHEIPKIAWFYQKTHSGTSFEDALDGWVQLSGKVGARLRSALDPESGVFWQNSVVDDLTLLLEEIKQQFGELVNFLSQFFDLLTRQPLRNKLIDPQRALLTSLESSLREMFFCWPTLYPHLNNMGGMHLAITEDLELDWKTILSTRAPPVNFLGRFMSSKPARSLAEMVRLGATIIAKEFEGVYGNVRHLGQLCSLVGLMWDGLVPEAEKGPIFPENTRLEWIGEFLLALLARWQEASATERLMIKRWVNTYEETRSAFDLILDEYIMNLGLDYDFPEEEKKCYPNVLAALKECEEMDARAIL